MQYAAIHNSFRQQMDGERPLITAVLGGSGYFERRNPDEGSDVFVKTRNRAIRVPERREVKNFIALNRRSVGDAKGRTRPESAKGRIESHHERQQRVAEEHEAEVVGPSSSMDLSFGDKMGRLAEAQEEIRAEQFGGTRSIATTTKAKARPQSARVASGRSATEWDDWDRNSVAAHGGAQSARSAEAWSSWDVNATERAQAVAAANEKFNLAHAATGRSEERWSEWDQTSRLTSKKPQRPQSARPVLMNASQQQQQQQQTGRSAEDWGSWDVSRTARASGANARSAPSRPQSARVPTKSRSLVAEEFVSSREMTMRLSGRPAARGFGEPLSSAPMRIPQGINSRAAISAGLNHPASSAPLPGMGPAVRSIAVNREIAAAVETVFEQGGIPRPIDFVPSRVNDIAKTEPKGPTVDRPSESHRTFLRNLEKKARQAGLTMG